MKHIPSALFPPSLRTATIVFVCLGGSTDSRPRRYATLWLMCPGPSAEIHAWPCAVVILLQDNCAFDTRVSYIPSLGMPETAQCYLNFLVHLP